MCHLKGKVNLEHSRTPYLACVESHHGHIAAVLLRNPRSPSPQSQEGHEQGTLGSRWSCDGCCTALRWDGRCTSGQLSSRDKTSCLDANSCPTWSPGKQLISNTPWVVAQPWRSSSLVGVQGRTKEFGMFADPNTACWCLDVAAADPAPPG